MSLLNSSRCIQYINGSKYLPGDETADMIKTLLLKQFNVSFVQMRSPRNRLDLTLSGIIANIASKNIDRGEVHYASDNSEYIGPNVTSNVESH